MRSLFIIILHLISTLTTSLQQYGLTAKEAKVYLTSLELGAASASSIARRCSENRLTVYSILKELQKKGVIQELKRNAVAYFTVVSPEVLFKNIEYKLHTFKQSLPEFEALANKSDNKPKLTYFEGISGLKKQYNDLLKTEGEIYSFLSDDDIVPRLKKFLNTEFVAKRQKAHKYASVIVSDHDINKEYLQAVKNDKFTKVKMMKHSFEGLRGEVMLYGVNKVAFVLYSPGELSGYTIESDQMFSSLKSIFTCLWNTL